MCKVSVAGSVLGVCGERRSRGQSPRKALGSGGDVNRALRLLGAPVDGGAEAPVAAGDP